MVLGNSSHIQRAKHRHHDTSLAIILTPYSIIPTPYSIIPTPYFHRLSVQSLATTIRPPARLRSPSSLSPVASVPPNPSPSVDPTRGGRNANPNQTLLLQTTNSRIPLPQQTVDLKSDTSQSPTPLGRISYPKMAADDGPYGRLAI